MLQFCKYPLPAQAYGKQAPLTGMDPDAIFHGESLQRWAGFQSRVLFDPAELPSGMEPGYLS